MANGDDPVAGRFAPAPGDPSAVQPQQTPPPDYQSVPQPGPGRASVQDYLKTMQPNERNNLALITKYEAQGQNVPNYKFQPGFTAEGFYQITHTNWRNIAPVFGIDAKRPMAGTGADQAAVALYLMRRSGLQNWTNYNPRLRQAFQSGEDGAKVWFGGGKPGGGAEGTAEAAEGPRDMPGEDPRTLTPYDPSKDPTAGKPVMDEAPAPPAQPGTVGNIAGAIGSNLANIVQHPYSAGSQPAVPIDWSKLLQGQRPTVGGPQPQPAPPPPLQPGQFTKDPRGMGEYIGED